MRRTLPSLGPENTRDIAYPTHSPPDPVFPCRTLEPVGPLLAGVIAPGLWSRLERPLAAALAELWFACGLGSAPQPDPWVSVQYGRVVLNAHGWEMLRAILHGDAPDPALVPPAAEWFERLSDRVRALAAPFWRTRVRTRVRRSVRVAEHAMRVASASAPAELDLFELARGPLDERAWTGILIPWFAERLLEQKDGAEMRTARALALERRYTRSLGERLAERGRLAEADDAALLTIEERLAAVNDPAGSWALQLQSRLDRVRRFRELNVPSVFWGTPRFSD